MKITIEGEPREVANFCREFQEKQTAPRVDSEGYGTTSSGVGRHAEGSVFEAESFPTHG